MRGLAWERRPAGLTLLIALAALAGGGLALGRQATYGATLYWDSIIYISAARNLLAGDGFADLLGVVYITWPPLYPLALAAAGLGIADPLAVAGPLNAAMFALAIFALGRYLTRRLSSRYLALWACLALALSIQLTGQAATALSESLFIPLTTLALIRADDYLTEGKRSALLWAALFSALAWQTRYVGVVVPAVVGLALLLQASEPLRDRLRRGVALGLIAGLPMAAWLLRNYLLEGRLTGHAPPVDYSLSELALEALVEFRGWVYFNPGWAQIEGLAFLPAASAALLCAMLGAIAVGYVIALFSRGERPQSASRPCWLFGGFALAYAALLFFSLYGLGRPHNGVEIRFLTPLYTPLVVIAAVGADRLLALIRDSERRRAWRAAARLAGGALLAAMTLWLGWQVVLNARAIAFANSDEFRSGYGAQPWASSQTLRHIREYPMDGEVFSNHMSVVWLHNDREARYGRMNSRGYEGGAATMLNDQLADARDGAWVVWFREGAAIYSSDGYSYLSDAYLPQMRALARLRPIAEFADGAIFRVDDDYRPDAGDNPYIAAYEGIAAGELAASAHSDFSVYWDGGRVIYFREPCVPQDIDDRFILNIFPADAADLPVAGIELGFVNADFDFADYGALFGDKCVAIAPLPEYPIERIRAGQYVRGGGVVWRVEADPDSASRLRGYADAYRAAAAGEYGYAAARADFDVYRAGETLVYVKEHCRLADVEARFFLHIIPSDPADLPAARVESGFDNLDFQFAEGGEYWDGKCVAVAQLPGYAIKRVRTGQYIVGADAVWSVDIDLAAHAAAQALYDGIAGGDYGPPVAQSDFDLYLSGNVLIYIRENCDEGDADARFFLHIIPADPRDLSAARRARGFANMDFRFDDYGAYAGDKCFVERELPDYAIDSIRTGQFVGGEGEVWRAEFAAGR